MTRETSDVTSSRVWQACVTCRRKKVKCDGNSPCHNCSSRHLVCEYPGSNDNASTSRNHASIYEVRFKQLDDMCRRLEAVTRQLVHAIEALPQESGHKLAPQSSASAQLEHVSQDLQSILDPGESVSGQSRTASAAVGSTGDLSVQMDPGSHAPSFDQDDHDEAADGSDDTKLEDDPATSAFGSLVHDAQGSLRFIGGASNELLVQAVQSLTVNSQESELSPFSLKNQHGATQLHGEPPLQLPLLVHDLKGRESPYLPRSSDLNLPPKYIADMLIGLYFDHYHYTFPVLYKPQFLQDYKHLYTPHGEAMQDSGFRSVFFAVCACASNLAALEGIHSSLPGLDFYERAISLHHATTGHVTLARVQCLALVSMCCAGWNSISTSWHFAGQAVREAQELGIHLSRLTVASDGLVEPSAVLSVDFELSRRIWWSIYCLDRVTSICLGRPMAINDNDVCCALPLVCSDEELEEVCKQPGPANHEPASMSTSPLSGFLEFARLCLVSGQVQSLQAPGEVSSLRKPKGEKRVMRLALEVEESLDKWLKDLPDELSFPERTSDRGPGFAMSIQNLVIHQGSFVSLYRAFATRKHSFSQRQTIENCVTAARRCIHSGKLLRDFVPPSHHLTLCLHYLTISGLVLLRMTDQSSVKDDPDIGLCIRLLQDLGATWPGAKRGKAIIEQILKTSGSNQASPSPSLYFQASFQDPGSHLEDLDLSDGALESFWGTF